MRRSFDSTLNNASGIYRIQSLVDSRCYIGSAVRFRKRYNSHVSELRKGTHRNSYLQHFFDKHGETALEFSIVECCAECDLLRAEQHYIDLLNPEFNLCLTAGNSMGRPCSESTRRKISEANKGKPKNMPPEWREYMKEFNRKKNISEEMRKKVSKAKSIPIAQYSLPGKFLKVHGSAKEAAALYHLSRSDINACCHYKKVKQVGGFQWRFYSGDQSDIAPYKPYHKRLFPELV